MTKFKMFQTVRLVRIPERDAMVVHHKDFRAPKVGDTGAVVEIYLDPHEHYYVDAAKPDGGCHWLMDLLPDELEPV